MRCLRSWRWRGVGWKGAWWEAGGREPTLASTSARLCTGSGRRFATASTHVPAHRTRGVGLQLLHEQSATTREESLASKPRAHKRTLAAPTTCRTSISTEQGFGDLIPKHQVPRSHDADFSSAAIEVATNTCAQGSGLPSENV